MPRLPGRHSDGRSHHRPPALKTFATGQAREVPSLPDGEWSASTCAWWAAIWSAPWALEYSEPDRVALGRLAELVEAFHSPAASARDKLALNAEIRISGQGYGLDAASRRRLGWRIESKPGPTNVVQRYLTKRGSRDVLRGV